jgi:hypothetical protein
MGRYYSGDIEGKFWFGLQSSNAASRFGGTIEEPQFIHYYFDMLDLASVQYELLNIEESLGSKVTVIEDFLRDNKAYNYEMLSAVGISRDELSEYVDFRLGREIADCIIRNESCSFKAEL